MQIHRKIKLADILIIVIRPKAVLDGLSGLISMTLGPKILSNTLSMQMRKILFLSLLVIGVSGCAYSIQDIDTTSYSPECIRQCTGNYSSCVSQGNQIGFKTETLRACREAYSVCVKTCPAK